jgi:hypothetical protein
MQGVQACPGDCTRLPQPCIATEPETFAARHRWLLFGCSRYRDPSETPCFSLLQEIAPNCPSLLAPHRNQKQQPMHLAALSYAPWFISSFVLLLACPQMQACEHFRRACLFQVVWPRVSICACTCTYEPLCAYPGAYASTYTNACSRARWTCIP